MSNDKNRDVMVRLFKHYFKRAGYRHEELDIYAQKLVTEDELNDLEKELVFGMEPEKDDSELKTAVFIMERLVQSHSPDIVGQAYDFLKKHTFPGSYEAQCREQAGLEAATPEAPKKYEHKGTLYDVGACGELLCPPEILHLNGPNSRLSELWRMEMEGGEKGRLASAALKYRDAVYSLLGQG